MNKLKANTTIIQTNDVEKPTLAIARRLFKRRNPSVKFNASWKRKPVWVNGGYVSTVRFEASNHKPIVMRLFSDIHEICIF